jgi:hypothetical protein
MKPPKLVQAMRKKIQNSEDRESSGAEESECGRVTGINFPIGNRTKNWCTHYGGGIPGATRVK